jgi:hypothetical protein
VPAVVAATTKPVPETKPEKPLQVAIAPPPPSPAPTPPPATSIAVPTAPSTATPSPTPKQIATITPSPSKSATASDEWKERIALVEKFQGELTFAKAMALLLDINSPEELTLLVRMEADIKSKRFPSAFAVGTSTSGNLLWAGSWNWNLPVHAVQTAIEQCARNNGDSCKAIMVNGELTHKEFVAVAKQLGTADLATVRQNYLAGIQNLPQPIVLKSAASASNNAYAYYSPR